MSETTENTPLYLTSFFTETDIVIDTSVPSTYNLVHRLVTKIVENHLPSTKVDPIVDAVLRRERVAPTVIGNGVAMPHARLEALDRPYLAVGVYPSSLTMDDSMPPVRLVFLLLVPESQPARYLQILRALANALRAPGAVDRLATSQTPADVVHFFRRSEMKLPAYICAADLMDTTVQTISQDAPLYDALEAFMAGSIAEAPVTDEHGCLVGVIDTRALLGCFVPHGLRRLPFFQTTPTPTLEPLAARLRETRSQHVREAMGTDLCVCDIEASGREIAAEMAERNAAVCYVVDKSKRLVGTIPVARFFARILRD